MISREQILGVMCAQNSGLVAQKTDDAFVKYVSGDIYVNS
jgi:hypothetical protein